MTLSRRSFLSTIALGGAALAAGPLLPAAHAAAAPGRKLMVYKSPTCGCCGAWITHMRSAGFAVQVTDLDDVGPVKARLGVAADLQSCHTAVVDGYVIEGHVPARDVLQLLAKRPAATGLAVPGMPMGSPGMEQDGQQDPYQVVLFSPTRRSVFAHY